MQNLVEYGEYFKDNRSMEVKRAYEPDETVFIWHKHILEIYLRLHGFSFENSLDKYVISNTKYIIHLAILPSGDFVYYTINKKTNQKANFSQAFKFDALMNQFAKRGIISN